MTSIHNKVIKNTLILYVRQILIMFVSLYSVRVVLDVLGVEDYGVYNVVGGVVTIFAFLSGTMASATQRFFSFAIGKNSQKQLNETFSINIIIYLAIAIIASLLLETVGLWFVKNKLEIPFGRLDDVVFVFHCSVITFVATVFSSPFMAILIAHEDMKLFTYISIGEVLLKLSVVLLLPYISWNKLQLYGVLLGAVSIINVLAYFGVCLFKYKECQLRRLYWSRVQFNEIVDFTGWTLFGQLTTVSRNQAITILLNQMFSPTTVAARAIATNVASKINMFANNFNVGLYPSIIKTYASNDKKEMFSLIYNGSKMTFFLMWIFALPLFVELDMVFSIWLKEIPKEALLFTRLALIEALILSISLPVATAARAPGKMKIYELSLGLLQVLLFGVAWFSLKMGGESYSVYIVAIIINIVMFFVRLLVVKRSTGLSISIFLNKVVYPLFGVVLVSSITCLLMKLMISRTTILSILNILVSVCISSLCMYHMGLNGEEKNIVRSKILKMLKYSK